MKKVKYGFALSIPGADLVRSTLMYDHQRLNGSTGINTKDLTRGYIEECRKPLNDWVEILEQRGSPVGLALVQTWRNAPQNPRIIAYSKGLGLCQSAQEQAELSQRPYHGIALLEGGRLRADTFLPTTGFREDVQQFGGGVPVLWNGRVLTIEEMVPEVADFSHLWRLQVSSTTGSTEKDADRFERFQAVFNRVRHAPAAVASEALLEEARGSKCHDEPLARERNYLHNVVGVRDDGGLVVIVAHGSLEELGEMALEAGAVSAVVVDNGGSCAVALRKGAGSELRPLIESYYHRPLSIAVAIYELAGDALGSRFVCRPMPWTKEDTGQYVTSHRARLKQVAVQFNTDVGVVTRKLDVSKLDSDAAESVALLIGNFAMVNGALRATVLAPAGFVGQVLSKFAGRFRVTPRSDDPTRLRGLWLDHYLEGVNGTPFEFGATGVTETVRLSRDRGRIAADKAPAKWALGLDIGAGNIKCIVLHEGDEVGSEPLPVSTRGQGGEYTSAVFTEQVILAVNMAVRGAGIEIADIRSIGVSWPGAIRNGRAAPSNTLLDMHDVLSGTTLNVALFESIRDIGPYLRKILNLSADIPVEVFNDGEVEVAYEACKSKLHSVLLCKLGTTVAGGFIDSAGDSRYLTELGRCVIRTDADAPRHPSSRIQGVASRLIGSRALAQFCRESQVTTINGSAVSERDAGRELSEVINTGATGSLTARTIISGMGASTAELLMESIFHLGNVEHILLRGGLAGKHSVGQLLVSSIKANLADEVVGKIVVEDPTQHSGAFAAAWLASRR